VKAITQWPVPPPITEVHHPRQQASFTQVAI
jgi:hypothetical protein